MLAAVEEHFGSPQVTRGPYLYRYVSAGTTSVEVVRHVIGVETRRIREGSIRAVGLRIVAPVH